MLRVLAWSNFKTGKTLNQHNGIEHGCWVKVLSA